MFFFCIPVRLLLYCGLSNFIFRLRWHTTYTYVNVSNTEIQGATVNTAYIFLSEYDIKASYITRPG